MENEDKDWQTYLKNYYAKIDKLLTPGMQEASELIIKQTIEDHEGELVFTDTQIKRAQIMFDVFAQPEHRRKSKKRKMFVIGGCI